VSKNGSQFATEAIKLNREINMLGSFIGGMNMEKKSGKLKFIGWRSALEFWFRPPEHVVPSVPLHNQGTSALRLACVAITQSQLPDLVSLYYIINKGTLARFCDDAVI
jgi:hypothetical protein